jgi:hypothetical protein
LLAAFNTLDEDLSDMTVGKNGVGAANEAGAYQSIGGVAGELQTSDAADEGLDSGALPVEWIPIRRQSVISLVLDVERGPERGQNNALEVNEVTAGERFVA